MLKKLNADSERIKKLKERFRNNSEAAENILSEKKDKDIKISEDADEVFEREINQILNESNPYILMMQDNYDRAIVKFEEMLKQPAFQDRKTKEEILDIMIKLCNFIHDPVRQNKYKTWKQVFVLQDKIKDFTKLFLEKRKNLHIQKLENPLNNLAAIEEYFIEQSLVASGHKEANYLFDLYQAYAVCLDTIGEDEHAMFYYQKLIGLNPQNYSTRFFIFNFYLERSKDRDDNYEKARLALQELLDIVNQDSSSEKSQEILIDIKEQYWQLCRKNNRHERAMKIVEDEFNNNDLLYLLYHFRFGLKFNKEILQSTDFQAKAEVSKIIAEVKKMIKSGGIKVTESIYLPEHYQLLNLSEIWLDSEINQNNSNILGHLYVKDGELEDIHQERYIRVYTEGLTEAEIYQVLLHEIGHNAYFLLSDQEKELWARICTNFNLEAAYRGQKQPIMEAFADYYASFILFNKLWHEMIKDEQYEQPRVIYNFFRNVFKLDKERTVLESNTLREDISNYTQTLKKTINSYFSEQRSA